MSGTIFPQKCLIWVVVTLSSTAACRGGVVGTRAEAGVDSSHDAAEFPTGHPDEYWLLRIGDGPAQRRRVCDRGRNDRVTRALCNDDDDVTGLKSLFGALRLESGFFNLSIATTSSGLTFRTTSVLNPRLFLTSTAFEPESLNDLVAVAFSRGDALVELVAFDAIADELNFYLLSYRQTCAADDCTMEEQLSGKTESSWKEWTLYDETDLEDTPLDCLSCHRPDGPGTPRRLLMRDIPDPWFHWLPPVDQPSPCALPRGGEHPPRLLAPDLRAEFERIHGQDGYAGHDIAATRSSDGHNLHGLVLLFRASAQPVPRDEPFAMDSRAVIDEWRCAETNDTWRAYRSRMLQGQGLPVPYYGFDVLDREKAAVALEDYPAYLRRHPGRSPFLLLRDFIAEEAQVATGGIIDGTAPAEAVLRQACIRCHDGRAPGLAVRARFRADAITADTAAAALRRLALPENSPYAMPPRRAGTLSASAKEKLVHLFQTRIAQ